MKMTEKALRLDFKGFVEDTDKDWASYMVITRSITAAEKDLGYPKTVNILKEFFPEDLKEVFPEKITTSKSNNNIVNTTGTCNTCRFSKKNDPKSNCCEVSRRKAGKYYGDCPDIDQWEAVIVK